MLLGVRTRALTNHTLNHIYCSTAQDDTAHDCFPGGNFSHSAKDDLNGLKCDKIPGSIPTGTGALHVLARTLGHMSSLAMSLCILPVSRTSVLLKSIGVSWEVRMYYL